MVKQTGQRRNSRNRAQRTQKKRTADGRRWTQIYADFALSFDYDPDGSQFAGAGIFHSLVVIKRKEQSPESFQSAYICVHFTPEHFGAAVKAFVRIRSWH
jgi:hypothetical protein